MKIQISKRVNAYYILYLCFEICVFNTEFVFSKWYLRCVVFAFCNVYLCFHICFYQMKFAFWKLELWFSFIKTVSKSHICVLKWKFAISLISNRLVFFSCLQICFLKWYLCFGNTNLFFHLLVVCQYFTFTMIINEFALYKTNLYFMTKIQICVFVNLRFQKIICVLQLAFAFSKTNVIAS